MSGLSRQTQRVIDALAAAGITADLVHLPDGAATAVAAAAALGTDLGAIANSLIFWADHAPILVMTSGAHRVNTDALATRIGKAEISRAAPEQVRAATGQTVGGVAPTGHPTPVETIVDRDLAQYDRVWAAAGSAHTVFAITFDDLVRLTNGTVAQVD